LAAYPVMEAHEEGYAVSCRGREKGAGGTGGAGDGGGGKGGEGRERGREERGVENEDREGFRG